MSFENPTPEEVFSVQNQIFAALGYLTVSDFIDYVKLPPKQVAKKLLTLMEDKEFCKEYISGRFIHKDAIKFFRE